MSTNILFYPVIKKENKFISISPLYTDKEEKVSKYYAPIMSTNSYYNDFVNSNFSEIVDSTNINKILKDCLGKSELKFIPYYNLKNFHNNIVEIYINKTDILTLQNYMIEDRMKDIFYNEEIDFIYPSDFRCLEKEQQAEYIFIICPVINDEIHFGIELRNTLEKIFDSYVESFPYEETKDYNIYETGYIVSIV